MALPELDPAQRQAALDKAAAARRIRADAKQRLKTGELSLEDLLVEAESSEPLAKLRISAVLEAMPAFGPVKAERLMERLGISPSRRVRGLGSRHRTALLETFSQRT